MRKLQLIGKVLSGRGEGKGYVELASVQRQIAEKLGFSPYAGTLNLLLSEEGAKQRKRLKKDNAMGICTSKGCREGLLFKAAIDGVVCGVVIPLVEKYPDDELEIVAEENLRKQLRLRDGDPVVITVF